MSEREQHRGTTLLRPRRVRDRELPPSPGPEPTPRLTGFWAVIVMVIAGTIALAAWALWPSATGDLDGAGSGYAGDWKDTVVAERAGAGDLDGAGSGHAGDWKDTVAEGRVSGPR